MLHLREILVLNRQELPAGGYGEVYFQAVGEGRCSGDGTGRFRYEGKGETGKGGRRDCGSREKQGERVQCLAGPNE